MISNRSIEEVRDRADVLEVIQKFIDVKKKGASYQACCPFHGEKTPSFHVTPAKGMYHCFGCGKSGDAIRFVMEYDRKDFFSAIQWLAELYQITLEEVNEVKSKEQLEEAEEISKLLAATQRQYQEALFDAPIRSLNENYTAPYQELEKRKYTIDTILQWNLGYAPDEWKFITKKAIDNGLHRVAEKIGLIKSKEANNYDVLRNRLVFPINDHRGRLIGFAGRDLSGSKEVAKYINPKESSLYIKNQVLYGLDKAGKAIRDRGFAYLVEGYTDVISMHQAGHENTVASCGTALTEGQVQLLGKYTRHVVILRDADGAGIKAADKDTLILVANSFKTELLYLPEGEDPESYLRTGANLAEYRKNNAKDAILHRCETILKEAGDDQDLQAVAINRIADFLSSIKDDVRRDLVVNTISKGLKSILKPAVFIKKVKDLAVHKADDLELEEGEVLLPRGVDRDDFMMHGFYEVEDKAKTGFYFASGSKTCTRLTNFIIQPLYHIYSKTDNKRLIKVTNGYTTSIIEMPSKALISLEQFCSTLFDEGHYLPEGGFSRAHLLKIVNKISSKFPLCYELKTLGWQPEGFFAYSNVVFHENEMRHFDEMGIVDVGDQKYISLSVSKVQESVRDDDDIYENDRYLTYRPAPIDFAEWCRLMSDVYGHSGWIGISWAIATLFRDIVFNVTKVPHLYAYGGVGAGKSEFGDSISNLFFNQMKPFNLNQGTDFAFFSRMERFRNTPNALNEFDEYAIKEEWFRAIKAAYDGEGREKGRGGKEGKTKTQKINCTILLMGQYLSTKDDNSVLTRCIPLAFREEKNRPAEQVQKFEQLKEYEKQGLSGILLELLKYRSLVRKNYGEVFAEISKTMNEELSAAGKSPKTRVLKNICAPLALVALLTDKSPYDETYTGERLKFPFSFRDFYDHCKDTVVKLSETISESNALSEFWKYLEFLLDNGKIAVDFDYKVESHNRVMVVKDGEKMEKQLDGTEKLLFIRISNVHKHYQNQYRINNGKNGLNEQSLMTYLKDQPYFIGMNPGSNFVNDKGKKVSTSSYVLRYDQIGVNLERTSMEDDREEVLLNLQIFQDAELSNIGGDIVKFRAGQQVRLDDGPYPKTESVFYQCFTKASPNWEDDLKAGVHVEVTGMLVVTRRGDKMYRSIDVIKYKLL